MAIDLSKIEETFVTVFVNEQNEPIFVCFKEFEAEIKKIMEKFTVKDNKLKTFDVPFLLTGYGTMLAEVAKYIQARREGRNPDEEMEMMQSGPMGRPSGRRY